MEYLTIKEAAATRQVSQRTIRRWIASGLLQAVRLGPSLIRISSDELARMERSIPGAIREPN